MEKKKIKIAFCDYCEGFNPEDNYIVEALRKYYNLEIIQDFEKRDQVEYLFYSCFDNKHLYYDCIKLFYTGENMVPDFNACDYAWGFEYLDFGDRYLRFPYYMTCSENDYNKMMERHQWTSKEQKGFCSFVVSQSAVADTKREEFFHLLSKYKNVSSGGRFLNNIGKPEGVSNKLEFQGNYKFCIAFENSSYPGYCTEKLMEAFASGAVPIYWGDPTVNKSFNTKSFINCNEYSSFDEVVERVIQLDQDDAEYEKIMVESPIIEPSELREAYWNRFEKWLCEIIDQDLISAKRVSPYAKMKLIHEEKLFLEELNQRFGPVEKVPANTLKSKVIRKLRLLKR